MKSRKLILSVTLLAALLVGAFAIVTLQASADVGATIFFWPSYYEVGSTPRNPWYAWITLRSGHNAVKEIDQSTILLQGLYSPSGPGKPFRTTLMAPFNGYDVQAAILFAISHMTPGTCYKVSLTITGKTYSGAAFSGSGVIFVIVPPPNCVAP
jgi:hypothetical protein